MTIEKKRVLLLNSAGMPVKVIKIPKAWRLLENRTAYGVTEDMHIIKHPKHHITIPKVVMLTKFYTHKNLKYKTRYVLQRDGYKCAYCGATPDTVRNGNKLGRGAFNVDHIVPRSKGGPTNWTNTICSCIACNLKKDNKTLEDAGLTLLYKPEIPRNIPLYLKKTPPKAWVPFLSPF